MRSLFTGSNKFLSIGIVLVFIVAIVLAVYIVQQQQNLRQEAAGEADLAFGSFMLTDAGGNPKTTFYENEDIYVRTVVKNQGASRGESPDDQTTSQVYSNKPQPVAFNTPTDVGVTMINSEFNAGTEYLYESRIDGERQSRFTPNPYTDTARKYSWRKSPGTYTARMLLNSNRNVTESDYENNQASISYTVIPFSSSDKKGSVSTTKPSNFDQWPCVERNALNMSGVKGCIQQIKNSSGTVWGRITNNSGRTITAVIASYKAYLPYVGTSCDSLECPEKWDWAWTQTFYAANTTTLANGQTIYISTVLPSCVWQADIFADGIPFSFHPQIRTYSGSTRYIDGWYNFYPNYSTSTAQYCKPESTPTPTPTKTPTGTPVLSNTPTPTTTLTPTLTPSVTPTPTIPICPVPAPVTNVRIECPFCDL